jgi:hypothetical protein
MMRWYLLALIFLLDEVHLKVAMGYSVNGKLDYDPAAVSMNFSF